MYIITFRIGRKGGWCAYELDMGVISDNCAYCPVYIVCGDKYLLYDRV